MLDGSVEHRIHSDGSRSVNLLSLHGRDYDRTHALVTFTEMVLWCVNMYNGFEGACILFSMLNDTYQTPHSECQQVCNGTVVTDLC